MKNLYFAILSVVLLQSCYVSEYFVDRDIKIYSQEQKIPSVNFQDSIIDITWTVNEDQLDFSLINVSDEAIKLIWDDAVFVYTDGRVSRVIHNNVALIDRNRSMVSSVLIPNSVLEDVIVPTKEIELNEKELKWERNNIYGKKSKKKRKIEEQISEDRPLFKVYLPIIHKGDVMDYTFVFMSENERLGVNKINRTFPYFFTGAASGLLVLILVLNLM